MLKRKYQVKMPHIRVTVSIDTKKKKKNFGRLVKEYTAGFLKKSKKQL